MTVYLRSVNPDYSHSWEKGKMTTFDKSVSTRSVSLDCQLQSVMIHVYLLSEGDELEEMTVTL